MQGIHDRTESWKHSGRSGLSVWSVWLATCRDDTQATGCLIKQANEQHVLYLSPPTDRHKTLKLSHTAAPPSRCFGTSRLLEKAEKRFFHTWQTSLTSSVKEHERMKVPDILPLQCASYLSTLLLNYATELTILCWSTQNGSQHLWILKNGTWLFLIVPICPISNTPASPLIIR